MVVKRIKIAYQQQANKPIYLLATGVIECGNFKYSGRYKNEFKSLFVRICDLVHDKHGIDEYDVSEYKYWDAINIYNDCIVVHWHESISAEQVKKFANETEIVMILEKIKCEFKRLMGLRWKRIFKKSDPNDPRTPTQAWQTL